MGNATIKRIISAGGAVLVAAILVACGSSNQSQEPVTAETGDDPKPVAASEEPATPMSASEAAACTSDADCVKDACCHATGCVPSAQAPNCEEVMCTMDCKEGTLDCGKGACACIDGACAVKWAQ